MIRIKVGDTIYDFHGTINVDQKSKFQSVKSNPYAPTSPFQFGKYFVDTLDISIISDPEKYESLYYDVCENAVFFVAWETYTGYQYREIRNQSLPYPSKSRFLNNVISFKLESEQYTQINRDMPNITMNQKFNVSTIDNTIF